MIDRDGRVSSANSTFSAPDIVSENASRLEWIGVLAILALALALRIVGLDAPLWYDEIDTLVRYVRMPAGELVQSYDSLNNHMFFSLQAQASVALFGEHPWAVRLPAMLWGVASIWVLWRLAREVVRPPEALLAALLMAVSYHHVWFSQNARGYTGLLFFGLLAALLLVRGMRRPSWGIWLAYGACFAAAMYTHLSAAFIFLAQGLAWALILAGAHLRGRTLPPGAVVMPLGGALAGIVATLVLFAPVMGQIAGTFTRVQTGPAAANKVASVAEWKNPLWMIGEVAASLGPVLAPLLPVVLIVAGIAAVSLWRRAAVLPLMLVLHIGLTVAIVTGVGLRIWPRYFFSDLGLICLLLIHGAFVIGTWLGPRLGLDERRAGLGLAALGVAASLVLLPRNYAHPKQDFPGARDYVEATRGEGAAVLTLGLTRMPYAAYYAPDWTGVDTLAEFEAAYNPGTETWLVYTFPRVMERRHADIFAAMGEDFEKARYFPGTLSGGGIVVLRTRAE